MIKIEDLEKIELRVGQIVSKTNKETIILCNGQKYQTNLKIDANKNDKIIIAINDDEIIIPLLNTVCPIIPDKDIEEGSKIR